jgi:hypothetical protein
MESRARHPTVGDQGRMREPEVSNSTSHPERNPPSSRRCRFGICPSDLVLGKSGRGAGLEFEAPHGRDRAGARALQEPQTRRHFVSLCLTRKTRFGAAIVRHISFRRHDIRYGWPIFGETKSARTGTASFRCRQCGRSRRLLVELASVTLMKQTEGHRGQR